MLTNLLIGIVSVNGLESEWLAVFCRVGKSEGFVVEAGGMNSVNSRRKCNLGHLGIGVVRWGEVMTRTPGRQPPLYTILSITKSTIDLYYSSRDLFGRTLKP